MKVTLSTEGEKLAKVWHAIANQSGPRPNYYPPCSTDLTGTVPIPTWTYAVDLLRLLAGHLTDDAVEAPANTADYEAQLQGVYFVARRRLGFSFYQTALAFEALVEAEAIKAVEGTWQSRLPRVREMLAALSQRTRFAIFARLCNSSPMGASQLGRHLGVGQELLRHHAKKLCTVGLLHARMGEEYTTYEVDEWAICFLTRTLWLLAGLTPTKGD